MTLTDDNDVNFADASNHFMLQNVFENSYFILTPR